VPDHATVAEVFARYAAAIDDADFDRLGDVFTEGASFTVEVTGGETFGPFEPRDAIVEFISSTTAAQQDQRRHVITNVRLGDEDEAYGLLSLFATAAGEVSIQTTGVYRIELEQQAGRWRLRSMRLTLDRPF
jgi:uncharacterized protein (TIGR02246 family)